jgi:pimeloyl-ACP methyl ester carboxylesterase
MLFLYKHVRPLLHLPFELGSWLARMGGDQFPLSVLLRFHLGERDRYAMLERGELKIITRSFLEAWNGNVDAMQVDAEVYLEPFGFNLAEIRYPVHFWHGKKDRNIPFFLGQKMSDLVPTSIRHWLPEDGHFSLPLLRSGEILDTALA